MHSSTVFTLFGLVATTLAAPAPAPQAERRWECAPGTGYFQVCANGFQGCSSYDECSGPSHTTSTSSESTIPEGTCAPGTGYYQVCSNGLRGCSTEDMCAWSKVKRSECASGTGYFQVCANGFRGCSTRDECSASVWTHEAEIDTETETSPSAPAPVPETPGTCPPGTGHYQVCANGFKGCSPRDECVDRKAKRDTCAPGTGYYQVCANGFTGCSTKDECSAPAWPHASAPASKPAEGTGMSNGACAPGTGYYQVCANGFKGCSPSDECSRS